MLGGERKEKMNAKVKGIAFSVITAMCILILTVGLAAAACGIFDQKGYVYYKSDGTEVTDFHENYNMTLTNQNTGEMWYKGDGVQSWSGNGYYKLTTNRPLASPYDEAACKWHTGDVAEYKIWSLDGNYENTTYYTMTDAEMIAAKIDLNIYVEAEEEETFTKSLPAGWNLISLPLAPTDNSTGAVLSGEVVQDAVYRYRADTKEFETASTMDPGAGYFVHVTTAGTWTYSGTAYTTMSESLTSGLNMVGWLNCTKTISDGLSSIADNYYYAARWNAAEQKFETFNPVAPSEFNKFLNMERGEGYFISMKTGDTLDKSC